MKSLTLALIGLLTTAIVFLWLCARFSDMRPITSAEAASPVGNSPYTPFARRPPLGKHGPRYSVTADGPLPPNAYTVNIMSRRDVKGGVTTRTKRVRLMLRHDQPPLGLRLLRLRPLPGYQVAFSLAANRHHQIVGYCHSGESGAYLVIKEGAFLWRQGRIHVLATLPDYQITHAVAINDKGVIVGDATVDSFPADVNIPGHAVCWVGGKVHDLGIGEATAINDSSAIVGMSAMGTADCPREPHALLWTHGYRYDLNDCIPVHSRWLLAQATDIDNRGRITGYGTFHDQPRTFLLTPRENKP